MQYLDNNAFQIFCSLSQRVQRVQDEVENSSIGPRNRVALHTELERLQDAMENLQNKAGCAHLVVFRELSQLQHQVISLYRLIEERFESHEIRQISAQALELSSSLEGESVASTAKKIDALRHNIHFLFQHRKPSMKNRRVIILVMKLSDQVDIALSKNGETSKEHLQLIAMLRTLIQEALVRAESFVSPEEGELAMELYEIADLYHHKRENEALMKLSLIRSMLTPSQQRRLDQAENSDKEMVQILLEIANGDPCIEWEERPEKAVIYALRSC